MHNLPLKEKCCGCHACSNICPQQCITMQEDNEGFLYPIIQKYNCINCNLCEKVCPVINTKSEMKSDYFVSYAANNKDDNIRLASSSGGIFTATAEHIIAQNGVVFGVALFDNCRIAKHIPIENIQYIHLLRGSKYFQSIIGKSYIGVEKILKEGRQVLFTGTPCQIEGLLSYLRKSYNNLYCMDIICHGVPSPLVWRKYLDFQEKQYKSKALEVFFRHKKYGWSKNLIQFKFKNASEISIPKEKDMFMQAFLKDVCLRPSCHSCFFKKKYRLADITAADLWGSQTICPELDDDKGTSAIFIHSEKGMRLFKQIQNQLTYRSIKDEAIIQFNPCMIKSTPIQKNRDLFFAKLHTLPFDVLVKKYAQGTLKQQIRNKTTSCIRNILAQLGILKLAKKFYRSIKGNGRN